MQRNQHTFIDLCIEHEILRFGEFQLKSGRISPYFFNAGLFQDGQLLNELSHYYAGVINEQVDFPFMLYGPAYKGIPLAAATAMQLAASHQQNVGFAYNRKETKDHGEGGLIVGAPLKGNVLIIDDVITAGTSIKESIDIIHDAGATPAGVVIALDRQESAGDDGLSAVQNVYQKWGIPVISIVKLADLIQHLQHTQDSEKVAKQIENYRDKYGCVTN